MPSVKSLHSFFTKARLARFIAIAKRHKAAARKKRMARVYDAAHNYHKKRYVRFVALKSNPPASRFYRRVHSFKRHRLGYLKTKGLFHPWYVKKFRR